MAPYLQLSMHQPHKSHLSSSTIITPVSSDCVNAFREHERTHGASSQNLHDIGMLTSRWNGNTLILESFGSKTFSFSSAQTSSHTLQPVHLSKSALTNFRSFATCSDINMPQPLSNATCNKVRDTYNFSFSWNKQLCNCHNEKRVCSTAFVLVLS